MSKKTEKECSEVNESWVAGLNPDHPDTKKFYARHPATMHHHHIENGEFKCGCSPVDKAEDWEEEFLGEFGDTFKQYDGIKSFIRSKIKQAVEELEIQHIKETKEAIKEAVEEERERIREILLSELLIRCECESGDCNSCDRLSRIIDDLGDNTNNK